MKTINEKKQRVLEHWDGLPVKRYDTQYKGMMPDAVEVIRHQEKEIERLRGTGLEQDAYYHALSHAELNGINVDLAEVESIVDAALSYEQALAQEVGDE